MILREHIPSYERLAPFMKPDMLMLGRQINTSGWKFPCEFKTLDPDKGDYDVDLGEPKGACDLHLDGKFQTVFNLGTLEHVWDIHQAYVNAASMVASGGFFLGQSPVAGWEGHGIHVTDWKFVRAFFMSNGFVIREQWFTTQAGNACEAPKRNCGKSILYWFIAARLSIIDFAKPSQIYKEGVKPS